MAAYQRPVSELIRSKDDEEGVDDEPKKRSREEFRKEKELEEARKAGTVPALVDEEGKDINPHIPQYIASAPWYYGSSGPTLKHQRTQDDKTQLYDQLSKWYPRGRVGSLALRYRKGACENCGAMGHDRKSCFERPRKVPAKVSGMVIAHDDTKLPDLKLDYDGKRDRWNGYDPKMYKTVIDRFNQLEEAKKVLKEEKLKEELINDGEAANQEKEDGDSDSDADEDEKYADHIDMPGTKVDSKQRITVRNLRIREDTAKYLRNLDIDSAYYDPKTRSMRDNPYKNTAKNPADWDYAGENVVRFSGDTNKVSQMQLFAWDARDKGVDIHLQAEPTKAEILHKEYSKEKTKYKSTIKSSILEKYGGEEYLKSPPKDLIFGQSERYVEYTRDGRPKTCAPKVIIRSKYDEDVYINNHTTVWGSWYDKESHKWGYKCCYSLIKNSYCVGEAGKEINDGTRIYLPPAEEGEEAREEDEESPQKEADPSTSEKEKEPEEKEQKRTDPQKMELNRERWSESSKAHKKKKRGNNLFLEEEDMVDDRKRPYNSMFDVKEPTEEELEVYRKEKRLHEDPMRQFP